MSENLRILSIGAHPADIFDQSGGTMAHHVDRGDYVACAVLTHGARVHDKLISDEMFHRQEIPQGIELERLMQDRSSVKAEEVRRGCAILGVEEVHFFDEDDAVLLLKEEIVKRLAHLLRQVRPDVVLTHFPKESNPFTNTHAIAGQIALYGIQMAGSVDPTDKHPPHKVAQVFFFGTGAAAVRRDLWGTSGGFTNDVFIDITDVIDRKLQALDTLISQGYDGAYARKRLETSDGAFGSAAHCAYAEGFIRMNSETHFYLPVTEHARDLARTSDHEIIARSSYVYRDDEVG